MYTKGMTTCQISEQVEDIYGFEVSEGLVSNITDKLLPKIEDLLHEITEIKKEIEKLYTQYIYKDKKVIKK